MTGILTNPTREELITATEANFTAYFEGFACLPHIEFHRDPEITWAIANGAPGNPVLHTNFTPENVDAKIDEALAYFNSHAKGGVLWYVTPDSRPANLVERLEAHGLNPFWDNRPVMTLELATIKDELNLPANFNIEPVRDEAQLNEWFVASAAGFDSTLEAAQPYYDAYACLGFNPDGPFLHYTGYLDNQPVTSSTLLLAGGVAGIYDVSTIPAARRQGLGRALTLYPLLEAHRMGYHYAILQSSHEGYNVYRRLGFTDLYTENGYFWKQD